jgi:nitrile hydratase accessory protein
LSQPELREPWQAEALALASALQKAGCFTAAEWAESLGAAIRRAQAAGDPDDGSTYYEHVLDALERLIVDKAIIPPDRLAARKEAWRTAFATTPHGQPVALGPPERSSD